ncbi:MAG TPA: SoxR reducing system RseC family protein [Spirochaetota bacterium]|nr:SoxR reducing system RseC family protein [Spirochaetota bacterium]HOK93081.1 SoxR reducing system RseC family protein [Spirochaetota bacterium]HPP94302.1 SoxR reducing system RseC family protein [Spirochaetota bacterium]
MHGGMNLDNKIQEGFILSLDGDIAHVRVAPNADCDNCGQCNTVHVELYAVNKVNAKIGQKVRFVMPDDNMLKVAFMAFIVPMISLILGIYLGNSVASSLSMNTTAGSFMGAILFLALSLLFVYNYDKNFKNNKKNFPHIIDIVR